MEDESVSTAMLTGTLAGDRSDDPLSSGVMEVCPVAQGARVFERIADDLRRQIHTGQLEAGEELPSEAALAEQHDVARGTVRQAFTLLEMEGLITVVPSIGRVVRSWNPKPLGVTLTAGREKAGHVHVGVQQPPGYIAELIDEEGELVRRLLTGDLSSVTDTWYPAWVVERVPALESSRPLDDGDLAVIERAGVSAVGRPRVQVRAVMADPEYRGLLGVTVGTPLLVQLTAPTGVDGRPLLVRRRTMAADRSFVEFDLG
ncbi:GntR family transcriptional regulator (plasmid) [Streptosporangium sandarakinum]|uniref:GntR family transcriptional regulator n=1 Tax=Streptosporangium sandarakinum TaxID=1260955 RepID=UPI003D92F750